MDLFMMVIQLDALTLRKLRATYPEVGSSGHNNIRCDLLVGRYVGPGVSKLRNREYVHGETYQVGGA